MRKLVLRLAASLDSEAIGSVEKGTSVLVIEEIERLGRVHIGSDFVDGVKQLGWVTREKDGEMLLSHFEQPVPPGNQLINCSSFRSPRPQMPRSPRPTKPTPSETNLERSLASRIAKRRQERTASRQGELGVTDTASEKPADLGGLMSSAQMNRLVEEERARAEYTGTSLSESFPTKVGRLVLAKGSKIDDLVLQWDRNGDRCLTKFEFSLGIRRLLDESSKNGAPENAANKRRMDGGAKERKEIDDLFDVLDDDHSGTLETTELKEALKKLADEVLQTEQAVAKLRGNYDENLQVRTYCPQMPMQMLRTVVASPP